jgi:nucleoside phosphorylase/glycerol-3-phosphate cytidylyltransferase-like family protein
MKSSNNVLIVTATKIESKKVLEVFKFFGKQVPVPISIMGRIFHKLGIINNVNIYMVQSEMGSTGLGASQQTVQKGIEALNPKAVIMVGIAFGIDSEKNFIGDILISEKLMLYELQRVGSDKGNISLVMRGDRPHASSWLIDYFRSADLYWDELNDWEHDCPKPKTKFGLILSGDKLIDNLDFREQLHCFEKEAIGGEMEGAGLYVTCQEKKVDWILIKAICDWADGNKSQNKEKWQEIAAYNAARFVFFALDKFPLLENFPSGIQPDYQNNTLHSKSSKKTKNTPSRSKVLVSDIFDPWISEHIMFLEEAAKYGDLYVAVASDKTINELKGREPLNNEKDRLLMIQALNIVKGAFISRGLSFSDFVDDFDKIQPDIVIIPEEGNLPVNQKFCSNRGIQYLVLPRLSQSTVSERLSSMPYRLDLAGGWLDQPIVSTHYSGPVINISIEPSLEYNNQSGLGGGTRRKAIDLWGPHLPAGDSEKLAKILFSYDNPPGTEYISGSQDAIGIVFPGLNALFYAGHYWPSNIVSYHDEQILRTIEQSLYLIPLGPRNMQLDVYSNSNISPKNVKALSEAALACLEAVIRRDVKGFGKWMTESFFAQVTLFPKMMNELVEESIEQYKDKVLGYKLTGAGGGGYLVLISEASIDHALHITIRR